MAYKRLSGKAGLALENMHSTKYMRIVEGAQYYSVGIDTFRKMAKESGAFRRIGKVVLVNTEDIERYIEMHKGEEEGGQDGENNSNS